LAGLPWSAVNLAKLSLHATGKGNARKPEMQTPGVALWMLAGLAILVLAGL
jgi:hypothetical protein